MFVRQSKFRHVFGKETKQDDCFTGIHYECNGDTGCAVNGKWVAVINNNKIFILPCDKPARFDTNTGFIDTLCPKIIDVAWNPFNDDQFACSSEIGSIKLYTVPEEGIADRESDDAFTEDDVTLTAPHYKKVTNIYWHPTAENILASISHCPLVVIWDMEDCEPICVIDMFSDVLFGLAWNYDGSRIATVSKDRYLRVFNPRTGCLLDENAECHEGTRGTKVTFTKDGRIITCGSDKKSERQMKLWAKDDCNNCLFQIELGKASAVLMPVCDYDLDIVYTFGKGEGVIKYYELGEEEIYYLSAYSSNVSQKGGNFVPKRVVNPAVQEIARFYKIHNNKDRIEPIQLIVPRKNDKRFQTDIYPPCMSGEPALGCHEWREGKDSLPKLHDLSEGAQSATHRKPHVQRKQQQRKTAHTTSAAKGDAPAQSTHSHDNGGVSLPPGFTAHQLEELLDDMKKVKATVRKLNKRVAALENQLAEVEEDVHQGEEEEEEEE